MLPRAIFSYGITIFIALQCETEWPGNKTTNVNSKNELAKSSEVSDRLILSFKIESNKCDTSSVSQSFKKEGQIPLRWLFKSIYNVWDFLLFILLGFPKRGIYKSTFYSQPGCDEGSMY